MKRYPSVRRIARVAGMGLLLALIPAAIIGWMVAAIYEAKIDEIHRAAELNGGVILLQLAD